MNACQRMLGLDDVLLDFFISNNRGFLYALSHDNFIIREFSLPKDFNIGLQSLLAETEGLAQWESFVQTLSEIILDERLLQLIGGKKHLIIIPDETLQKLPFDLLKIGDEFLIEKFSIQYLFGASFMKKQPHPRTPYKFDYIGFAPTYQDGMLEEFAHSEKVRSIFIEQFNLSPLAWSGKEVESSEKLFKSKTYFNRTCTAFSFRKAASIGKILHLTNHVLLNNSNPDLSAILFYDENGSFQLLDNIEIQGMDIPAELSILSSCNSGTGESVSGDGLKSIAQSFAIAGCPSIIANLWSASDYSSSQIISQFNVYLKEGKKKSEALRLAKIDYLRDASPSQKHPKYWANLMLIGSDVPLELKGTFLPSRFFVVMCIRFSSFSSVL